MIVIRPGQPDDIGFVLCTWKPTLLDVCKPARKAPHLVALMRKILTFAKLHIACPDDAPTTISGWVLSTDGDIWWMYVPFEMRGRMKNGIKISDMLREAAKGDGA